MELTIKRDLKLPREINESDNFFMVNYRILHKGKEVGTGESGVIDPELKREEVTDSIKNIFEDMTDLEGVVVEIIYVSYFSNQKEYEKYKLNNQ